MSLVKSVLYTVIAACLVCNSYKAIAQGGRDSSVQEMKVNDTAALSPGGDSSSIIAIKQRLVQHYKDSIPGIGHHCSHTGKKNSIDL